MTVNDTTPFPANSNPFLNDAFHMGTQIGTNCTIMYGNHSDKECKYIIVIDTKTGERKIIHF